MAWIKDAITPGEIDALKRAAHLAWDDDTRYPRWSGSKAQGGGQCYVTARWLVERLGGYVGVREGHYAWVSPDGSYALDLTGNHTDESYYGSAEGFDSVVPTDDERSRRFTKRADLLFSHMLKSADGSLVGDALPAEEPQRKEDINNQYWHDEPGLDNQDSADGVYNFIYAQGQIEVSPSSIHNHNDLKHHLNLSDNDRGPIATGYVIVQKGQATWEVSSNVNIKTLHRIFKDYSKHVGWHWGGVTNIDGEPISDEFAPKKSADKINYVFDGEHLYLGKTTHAVLALKRGKSNYLQGRIEIIGNQANVYPISQELLPSLFEWAEDQGVRLYSFMNNEVKRHEDIEIENLGKPDGEGQNPVEPNGEPNDVPHRDDAGVYRCPACQQLFPNWKLYEKHRRDEESWDNDSEVMTSDNFPEVNMDATFPTHFTERQPQTMPITAYREAARVQGFNKYARVFGFDNDDHRHYVAYLDGSPVGYASIKGNHIQMVQSAVQGKGVARALLSKIRRHYSEIYTNVSYDWEEEKLRESGWVNVKGQTWKWAAGQQPSDMIEAPIPFIYDIDKDHIGIGHPGQRTSDIPGKFTPGGIVEGTYEPGGKVILTTMTNTPYSVRHMIELWYYTHPELTVKSVNLRDDSGGDTKLAAAANVGIAIKSMVHANPVVDDVQKALFAAGGHVYAVGGAVRDAVMDKPPKDIDLMVTGLPEEQVEATLKDLSKAHGGWSGKTGENDEGEGFGVFRYRRKGEEVEVALPRTETSTGPDHKDFDVDADHTLAPEEDLKRRDFTANAMAVDLANGQLLDPHGGANDISTGTLRTVSPESLSEDPLRVVRALVAHGRHGLVPDEATRAEMTKNSESVLREPSERIQHELDKLFASDNPAAAIRLAQQTGVLKHILPEVDQAFGYDQNNPHHELELGDHLLNVLDRTSTRSKDPDLRMAALLHDIGKPASEWVDPVTGKNHYYRGPNGEGNNHEDVGAEMAIELMRRLRYPENRIGRISDLIRHHMWKAFTTPRGARKFLNKVGDHAQDLLDLRWADQGGKSAYPTDPTLNLDTQASLIDQVRNEQQPTNTSQLAINGNDLIGIGIPQGPQIGAILNQLTEAVIDDPSLNDKNILLTMAQNYANLPAQ